MPSRLGSHHEPCMFSDRAIFTTRLVTVGEFRCTVNHPRFEDSGPIRQDCFVFPRFAVGIQHEHDHAFVANSNVVTYYNEGQAYRRQAISAKGDDCVWYAVDRRTVCDVLESAGIARLGRSGPFVWTRGPADAHAFVSHQDILDCVHHVGADSAADEADIEERVVFLLDRTVRSTVGVMGRQPKYRPVTRDAIYHLEALLSTTWNQKWQLSALAERAGLSAFHLCRAFRALTGRTIHQYRQQLRLRSALRALGQSPRSLVEIALDAGFSSHSHFTSAFRREFGVVPSGRRRAHAESAAEIEAKLHG